MNTDSATSDCHPIDAIIRTLMPTPPTVLEAKAFAADTCSSPEDYDMPCLQTLRFMRKFTRVISLNFRFMYGFDSETTKTIMQRILYDKYLELVSQNSKYLNIVPTVFIDAELCAVAAERDIGILRVLPRELKNKNFITQVVRIMGFNPHIPSKWRSEETCLIGIKSGFDVIKSMEDSEFTQAICDLAVEVNVSEFTRIPEQFRTQEMYNKLFSKDAIKLRHVPTQFINEGIIQQHVMNNGDLSEIPAEALTKRICENVVEAVPRAIMTVPENFLTENMIVNAVYGGVNCLNRIKSYHFTEKVCIALLASLGLHQKDLPRAFQTTDFAQRALSRKINPTALMFSF